MLSASKKINKGKKRATLAELANDRLLEELEAQKEHIAELKATRVYTDGGNSDKENGGNEEDDEDEREERQDEGASAEASPGEEPKSGQKAELERKPLGLSFLAPSAASTPPCLAQPGKASAGHVCARCNRKKVRCSFRDLETGLRSRPNRRKDPTGVLAGSEADLADLVCTPLQAYLHGSIVDDLLMCMGTVEIKVAQLELGQQAAGLQQIKAEPEPESEPGLIPVLVQVSCRDRNREPGPSWIDGAEDVEMGKPGGEPEPEGIPEVRQPEDESRVEGPIGGEERLESEGEPAIVPEEIEAEEQCDVPVDAPVEPQVTAPVDVPEPETTAGPAEAPEVKQEPEESQVPRREPVKIMVDICREVVKGKEVEVIELMDTDEE
ncbi:hypothetical protein GGX14DRAFT_559960 [Mycena pura]|uniref:Uncharacterized protein n=1 Tax=Mycena pura TaxID=153505 RepID=A0AAD6YGC8_9AGAR|nr:hypothetical protein GGX14DRAFT_559960 [Mycena pura]